MTGFLLDTNIALIGLAEPERIPAHVRNTLDTGLLYLSVISYWEVVLQVMKGNLDVGDPRFWWTDALEKFAAAPLPLRPNHVSVIHSLELIHQDPFDRALIAQAMVENLIFATTDSGILKYSSERFQVLS